MFISSRQKMWYWIVHFLKKSGYSETWFKQSFEANFNNLCAFHRTKANGPVGLSIYEKNNLDINLIEDPIFMDNSIEQIWGSLKCECETILLGCIYRPPKCAKIDELIRSFNRTKELIDNHSFSGILLFRVSIIILLTGILCRPALQD